jgi:Pvc16 N-terminal domain/Carboxypeptidase regulatory-like domain
MIDYLDDMLRQLFMNTISDITAASQVSFEPPDDDFRSQVKTNGKLALNVYLTDLRENRVLRSNERVRISQNGIVSEIQAPRRMDCHYLISAWSPATASGAVEPTEDEHLLLYKVITALMDAEPFVPSQILVPAPLPTFWDLIADQQLPSVILPVEGFPKLAEFWGATKTVHWKPGVYLIVTLPVVMPTLVSGPIVTTTITDFPQIGSTEVAEVLLQIGGSVLAGAPPAPVTGAWVRLEDSGGKPLTIETTDANGHFLFDSLQGGTYTLRVRAQGFAEGTKTFLAPSATGNYDVQLV